MIGQNINQLINIAESQSDERLAQELNPQTETGMLGPTWLPASELSFRQKIRAEAQAQPQNNPPIVQQLAQSAMPQQMMPQQMMPQQMPMAPAGMSAQPMMPAGMPQQMPPQMMSAGGLVRYAHGGDVEGATTSEQNVLRGLWDKMTRRQKEEMMNKPSEGAHVPFNSYEEARRYEEFVDSPEWEQLVPGGSYEEPQRMSAGGLVRYANGGQVDPFEQQSESQRSWQLNRPFFPEGFSSPAAMLLRKQQFSLPPGIRGLSDLTEEQMREMATDAPIPEEFAPIRKDIVRKLREGAGYGTTEETETEIDALNILKQQGDALNQIQSLGGATGYLTRDNPDYERMSKAEDFYEGLMGSPWKSVGKRKGENMPTGFSPIDVRTEQDALTMSRYFANNPDSYKALQELQAEHGDLEGLLRFSEKEHIKEIDVTAEKRPVETVMGPPSPADDAAAAASFVGPPKPVEPVAKLEGIEILPKETSVESSTTSTIVGKDIEKGMQSELDMQLEEIMKPLLNQDNQMNRKWMAIAAGAFNAAQKGAPTLMAGLADLGGGVTAELQNLDKEDQKRAEALFDIYNKRQQLAELRRGHDLTYDAALRGQEVTLAGHRMSLEGKRYAADISWAKTVSDRIGASVDDVLNATKAFDAAKKADEIGDIGTVAYMGSIIDYMGQGVQSAGLEYDQMIGNLSRKEQEIKSDIPDFDPDNEEHRAEATAEFMEYLEDNPDMKMLWNDYWGKYEEGGLMPFDMTSFLTLSPRRS